MLSDKVAKKRRKLTGELVSIDNNTLVLNENNEAVSVMLDNIDKANLVYQFD